MTARRRRIVRAEDLVGRRVTAADGRIVGHIEEIRARRRGDEHEVTEYLLGSGALAERFALVRRLVGRRSRTLIARWDQIDISRPDKPTLTCGVDALRHGDE